MVKKSTHPKGERKIARKTRKSANELMKSDLIPVDTFGGKVQVRWDKNASLTSMGQLSFFIEYLKVSGLFDRWVKGCPINYSSGNAPEVRDVLGTILLSVLSGHKRYSHITNIRCDTVNPPLLGMVKVVSEDAVRRALLKLEDNSCFNWLSESLMYTYSPILTEQWILDVDTTIKPLYGKQEGAVIGYNPHKPGRPSHTYHSYMISNIRLMLDVDVHSGNEVASKHTAPGIWSLLGKLSRSSWPSFIRGDCGFGTDAIMTESECIGLPYLFKLKRTNNVKKLVRYQMKKDDWVYAGQEWEGVESSLKLSGWQHKRRVIILRRPVKKEVAIATKGKDKKNTKQLEFELGEIESSLQVYEYAVLITSLSDEVHTIAQHYRDRADCENNFDELKNQWGWGGFTTQDIKRCRTMAKIIALIYNWWSLFIRLIYPNKHTEAITSRPLMLQAVGKLVSHANQKIITVCSIHSKSAHIQKSLTAISSFFKRLSVGAEQLADIQRWYLILSRIFVKYLKGRVLKPPDLVLDSG